MCVTWVCLSLFETHYAYFEKNQKSRVVQDFNNVLIDNDKQNLCNESFHRDN